MMADTLKVAVLISGRGSNMKALIDYEREADPAYEVVLVAANVPEARGLVLARRFGIATWAMSHKGLERAEFDRLLDAELRRHRVEAIALAGYMRLLSDAFIAGWEGRILNVHPSLLPLYKGLDTSSVHLVTAELDSGPVLAQARVRIGARDDADSLAERVLAEEHRLYPRALGAFARERLAERERGDGEARNG
jgi:formyltetrahydrofolate-dependent phosphoribosylglycinamide formyltransferase